VSVGRGVVLAAVLLGLAACTSNDGDGDSDIAFACTPGSDLIATTGTASGSRREAVLADHEGRLLGTLSAPSGNGAQPTFSPDGRRVAYVGALGSYRYGPSRSALWVSDLDGTNATRLTGGVDWNDDPQDGRPFIDERPDWSPVDDRIVYQHRGPEVFGTFGEFDGTDLFVVEPGGEPRVLIDGGPGVTDRTPKWSPDGTQVAFVRAREGYLPVGQLDVALWVATAEGTDLRRLADATTYDELAWAPDGRSVFLSGTYEGRTDRPTQLRQVDAATGEVSTSPRVTTALGWSNDGQRLFATTWVETVEGYRLTVTTFTDGQVAPVVLEPSEALFANPNTFDVTTCPALDPG
jgi:Tol biopolymer transport system component